MCQNDLEKPRIVRGGRDQRRRGGDPCPGGSFGFYLLHFDGLSRLETLQHDAREERGERGEGGQWGQQGQRAERG